MSGGVLRERFLSLSLCRCHPPVLLVPFLSLSPAISLSVPRSRSRKSRETKRYVARWYRIRENPVLERVGSLEEGVVG